MKPHTPTPPHLTYYNRNIFSFPAQMGNILEMHWAKHSDEAWFDRDSEKTKQLADAWWTWSHERPLDWHMANKEVTSVLKFPLPLPDWFNRL